MKKKFFNFSKVKEKYLQFLNSQEILGEPFRDKLGQLNNFYLPICEMINKNYLEHKKTRIIGLAGSQGSGKSTIAKILKIILKTKFNLETVVFSIDDFYKTYKDRRKMSKKISHLFLTRGVPATHDTKKLYECLKSCKKESFRKFLIPKFDKSTDDRCLKNKWLKILKKPNIIIFEGWCVGARPQKNADLIKPVNELEKKEDKSLIWRKKVNNELKDKYKKIFNLIDELVFLKVPNFKYVYKWRLLQEKKLKKYSRGKKIMNSREIKRFIMFYERVTRNMIKTLGTQAKILIKIDAKHRLKSIRLGK
jgi:D-glycerate 3-kinase